ncbi:transmembrane protein 98-like [Gordionus sp. m RMFG-2023]|uniref:transmembrane protein 98-like n=1 Tax=Gordionus sp. m RMFG-2023 TaxID=3053472 RepID=UPI0031FC7C38
METVVILAITVLMIILIFAVISIGFILKYKFWSRSKKYMNIYSVLEDESQGAILVKNENEPDWKVGMIKHDTKEDSISTVSAANSSSNDPNRLVISERLLQFNETFVKNQKWAEEVSNLMPHCLSILKLCQNITRRLVSGNLFSTLEKNLSKEQRAEIVIITRAIGPRVDDVVRAMYPPLDPRLLEARLTSLYLAVCHLVYVTNKSMSSEFQNEIAMQKHWLNQSILRIEDNLKVLRKVSLAFDTCIQLQNLSYATENFRYDKIGKNFPNQNIAVISL